MNNKIEIFDASIRQTGEDEWLVSTGNLRLAYRYTQTEGLLISSFENLAGSRPVQYIARPSPILPFAGLTAKDWQLQAARLYEGNYGGRATVWLELVIETLNTAVILHVVAFPGASVVRQWFDIRNTSIAREAGFQLKPLILDVEIDEIRDTYHLEWVHGGDATKEHGLLYKKAIGRSFARGPTVHLHANMTSEYIPLVLVARAEEPRDGIMAALEYCGPWDFEISRSNAFELPNTLRMTYSMDDSKNVIVPPLGMISTPAVTLAVYAGSRDNLMRELYDWQYTYLWDYTNPDYYAKTRSISNWVYCSRNLHEQFTYRTAVMNINAAVFQRAGYEIVWDDAGWSTYPGWPENSYGSVFHNTYEGPDYRTAQRYFRKCGLKWLLWFAGKPGLGILENKEGAWGPFEWRTDGLGIENHGQERAFKQKIRQFLDGNIQRSFHTCSGGSTYAHTFDIQRYTNYNYLADIGAGPYMNYYFSFFEVPDKWGDLVTFAGRSRFAKDGSTFYSPDPIDPDTVRYIPEFARARLGMVPLPGNLQHDADIDATRVDILLYRFLLKQGVAGRWSYMYHPKVFNDDAVYYLQRVSHDHLRSLIILRHRPENQVQIFPRGLLDDASYQVSFQNQAGLISRSGRDLMENGLVLAGIADGELIYLNLPDRPGSGINTALPARISNVLCRYDHNIGYEGISIYWAPCPDNEPASYYEVARDGLILAQVVVGSYWFDREPGWSDTAVYAVRAVNSDGSCGDWQPAGWLEPDPFSSSALGNHGAGMAANGWSAEYSIDLRTFNAMSWIDPAACPLADLNGTPNQTGGIEGYWQGGLYARVGRGWQQASPDVYCVRSYRIDRDGKAAVTGRAMKEWYHQNAGCDLAVCILLGDQLVLPWKPLKKGDLYGADHNLLLDVKSGDILRFVLGKSSGFDEEPAPFEKGANLVGWLPVVNLLQDKPSNKGYSMRINCGGGNYEDAGGQRWQEDCCFHSGEAVNFPNMGDTLTATGRAGGKVSYKIPVPRGIYTLRLRFTEPEYRWSGERLMDLAINGKRIEQSFDIAEIVRGGKKTLDKVYPSILPDGEGNLTIDLTSVRNAALIQAIEIADEIRDQIHINCGSDRDLIDWSGCVWENDRCFQGGTCIEADEKNLLQASPTLYDRRLYFSGRQGGDILYSIPVKEGLYSVHLKFAELWLTEPDQRHIDILINGLCKKQNWDAAAAAEFPDMAADLRFDDISPANGCITIRIKAVGDLPAVLQAIECD